MEVSCLLVAISTFHHFQPWVVDYFLAKLLHFGWREWASLDGDKLALFLKLQVGLGSKNNKIMVAV